MITRATTRRRISLPRSLLLLPVLLLLCLPSYAEDTYEITETELNTLELNLTEQQNQITMLQRQLTVSKNQLSQLQEQLKISDTLITNAQKYLTVSEKEERKEKIRFGFTVGGLTLTTGFCLGTIIGVILTNIQ